MPELPYFDLLIDERQDGGETGQLWEHQVHWGYWEDPKAAEGTRADYIAAMEQMNGVLLKAGKVADGQRLLDVGCGFGGTIQQINAGHSDMHLTGLNIDPRQLAAAEAQTTATNGNHDCLGRRRRMPAAVRGQLLRPRAGRRMHLPLPVPRAFPRGSLAGAQAGRLPRGVRFRSDDGVLLQDADLDGCSHPDR